jgi:hypothetical protein
MRRIPVIVLLVLACGPRGPAGPPTLEGPLPLDDLASTIVTEALAADARLASADSLYETGATVVADGEVRYRPPRYAGVAPGGAIAITSTRTELRAGLAVIQVEYRWYSTVAAVVREAVATFIIGPNARGEWRIRHAHSSSPRG